MPRFLKPQVPIFRRTSQSSVSGQSSVTVSSPGSFSPSRQSESSVRAAGPLEGLSQAETRGRGPDGRQRLKATRTSRQRSVAVSNLRAFLNSVWLEGQRGIHEIDTREDSCSPGCLRRCDRRNERLEHLAWHRTGCVVTLTFSSGHSKSGSNSLQSHVPTASEGGLPVDASEPAYRRLAVRAGASPAIGRRTCTLEQCRRPRSAD